MLNCEPPLLPDLPRPEHRPNVILKAPLIFCLLFFGGVVLALSRPVKAIRPMPNFPAAIDLSTLNGSNGFRLNGINAFDTSGYAVNLAGDVNQDGFDDLIIGAPTANPDGRVNAGVCYVILGRANFGANFNLAALNGSNGFRIEGIHPEDQAGQAVAPAGDVNHDGYDDLLIGAPFADADSNDDAGESYIIFGQPTFADVFNLAALDGTNGFRLDGVSSGDYAGAAVGPAGDLNNDGFDDIVIGARLADPDGNNDAGASYVVFGQNTFPASLDLSSLDGSNGFRLTGSNNGDFAGGAVGPAGNVNGDTFDDLILSAPLADPNGLNDAGESYVIFGRTTFPANLNLATLNGSTGFRLIGVGSGDESGRAVSCVGDVNQDGFADVAIGAPLADPGANHDAGEAYLVFGRAVFTATLHLATLDGSNGFRVSGLTMEDQTGRSLGPAGDINDDGFNDLIIGAPLADAGGDIDAGEGYVVFGQNTFAAVFDLAGLDGSNGFRLAGIDSLDQAGWTVSGLGDLNGNGVQDVVISAPQASHSGQLNAGETYVVFDESSLLLTPTGTPPTLTPTNTPIPPTLTPTNTPIPPTLTPTNTPIPPTLTPTNTPIPPTLTPTNTPIPPTLTPTNTPISPTPMATDTPIPPPMTPTSTSIPPTPTATTSPTSYFLFLPIALKP